MKTLTEIDLSDVTRDMIGAELLKLTDHSDPDRMSASLYQAFALLPTDELQAILDFGRHADSGGVGVVRNLPVDPQLPLTPVDGNPSPDKQTFVAEGVLLGLSSLLGVPIGFTTEKSGQLVHDVVPVEQGAMTQTNQGSVEFLNFHNDIVYDALGRYDLPNPDFLVLNCLRQDPGREAVTYYADARDVCARLDDEVVATLRKPLFQLNAPGSYVRDVAGGEPVYSEPIPIISGPDEAPEIAISANGVSALTTAANEVFALVQQACRDVAHGVKLEPGTAMLINNRKGLHARSPFVAKHDGTDRWLQRTYVRRDLWSIRYRKVEGSRRVH